MRARNLVACVAITLGGGLLVAPARADGPNNGVLSYEQGVVTYRATPGVANSLFMNWSNFGAGAALPTFADSVTDSRIGVDESCGFDPAYVGPDCPAGASAPPVAIYLGDGNDYGSSTNDLARDKLVTIYGEEGDDRLYGEASTDQLYGGPGNDLLYPDSGGVLRVSVGDVVSGGDGIDYVSVHDYAEYGMRITLDGEANDGELNADGVTSAETDNYLPDIENIGGAAKSSNQIIGSPADNVIAIENEFDDIVDGGAGADTISTDGGDDTIHSRDGFADAIDCGYGSDTVVADDFDVLTGCEQVDRGPFTEASNPGGRAKAAKTVDATTSGKRATLKVRCSVAGPCSGKILVKDRARVLAKGRYRLDAGSTSTARIILTRSGRRALGARAVRVTVRLVARTGEGSTRRARLIR